MSSSASVASAATPAVRGRTDEQWRGSVRRLLWSAALLRRRDVVAATVLFSTHQLGESMVPVIIGVTIDHAIAHGGWQQIVFWLAVLAVDFVFLSLSYRFGARAAVRAGQYASHRIRMRLTERVVQPGGGIRLAPGDLLSRASSDATRVGSFAAMVARTVAAVVVLVAATAMLLSYSLILGATILVGTVVLLGVQHRVARLLERRSGAEQGAQARATSLAEDIVRGLRVLRGIGAQRDVVADYQQVSRDAVRVSLHAVSAEALMDASANLLTGLYLAIIAMTGGILALDGRLGLGALVSALGLAQFIVGPMRSLSTAHAAYARALASAHRVHEVLAAESAVRDGSTPHPLQTDGPGAIRLAGAPLGSVRVDADLPPGRQTGIVCSDATGAAEFARLLARETDPAAGLVALDGVDITQLPLEQLHARVLVALHDADLLPGSIADNLGLLASDAPATVAAAAHAAFADQVVDVVPAGADAYVGDRGELLSGGQRQRILLARALAAGPPVLVLHDPTTAVDAVTEDQIARRVTGLRAGRTTLVITTSPAWLSRCDSVLFVGPDGARSGTHAELLADSDAYSAAVTR